MKKIIFLRGLPGSGKTTLLENLKIKGFVFSVASKDFFRKDEKGNYYFSKDNEPEVQKKYFERLETLFEKGEEVIFIDNLNLTEKSFEKERKLADEYKYQKIAANFQSKSIDFHTEKNTKKISEREIRIFKKHYQEFSKECDINFVANEKNAVDNVWEKRNYKPTAAESALRRNTVYEMIIKGARRPYILRYAAETWGVGSRQVDCYLKDARKMIDETFGDVEKEKLINEHRAKLSNLYTKNYTIEDFRECRSILESERKLLGIDEAVKQSFKGEIEATNIIDLGSGKKP